MSRRCDSGGREDKGPPPDATGRIVLHGTVALTGAGVMVLELLGARVVEPYYGVNLFTWSALISVTLMALAVGYFLGGRLADRASRFQLSHAIALAALWSALIPESSRWVLTHTNSLGLRWGVLASTLLLFAPPLTFLSMAGPWVIRLTLRRVEGAGTAAGTVYAISTLGSVAGTLVVGFFLLPAVGTRATLYGVSGALLAVALGLAAYERRVSPGRASTGPVLVILGVGGAALFSGGGVHVSASGIRMLYETESVYGWLRVIDDPTHRVRWMLSDASIIGALRTDTGRSPLLYQRILETLPWFRPGGHRALLIGLGGGQVAQALQRLGVVTDVIEIDPEVAGAARTYFGFDPPGRVVIGDARYEIRKLTGPYDFIIHDCFSGGRVPSHLLSREMLLDMAPLLDAGGILAVNFVGFTRGDGSEAARTVYRTVGEVFPYRRVLVSLPGETFNDFVFLASSSPLRVDLSGDPIAPDGDTPLSDWLAARDLEMSDEGGVVITDDVNPLERMQARKAEVYRDLLLERLGPALLVW